jgi:hypothetical protein
MPLTITYIVVKGCNGMTHQELECVRLGCRGSTIPLEHAQIVPLVQQERPEIFSCKAQCGDAVKNYCFVALFSEKVVQPQKILCTFSLLQMTCVKN